MTYGNEIQLSHNDLQTLIETAAELGALKALIDLGTIKPYMNKSEAFRRYGRSRVTAWINKGLLLPYKDGTDSAAWRIERFEIELIDKLRYLPLYKLFMNSTKH
ncbi:MAG: hypothetical protein QHC79_25950 [Pseudosphingobacterium sp.]|nr:hypothetical protein [Pseudosphingobacterium sp.]